MIGVAIPFASCVPELSAGGRIVRAEHSCGVACEEEVAGVVKVPACNGVSIATCQRLRLAIGSQATRKQRQACPDPRPFAGLRLPPGTTLNFRPLAVPRDGSRIFFAQAVEQPNANVIHVATTWPGR